MLILAFPMLTFVVGEQVSTPRDAQARLAETLASADAVTSVRANADGDHTITFAVTRDGEAYRVIAQTDDTAVVSLSIVDAGPTTRGPGNDMSWLVTEMHDVTAVPRLTVDAAGHVTLSTSDGRRYAARPHHGPKVNAGVEARWAAAWDA